MAQSIFQLPSLAGGKLGALNWLRMTASGGNWSRQSATVRRTMTRRRSSASRWALVRMGAVGSASQRPHHIQGRQFTRALTLRDSWRAWARLTGPS